jgi:hypothetical protein
MPNRPEFLRQPATRSRPAQRERQLAAGLCGLLLTACGLLFLVPPRVTAQEASSSSLGEVARELRQKKQAEVRLRPEDVTALFASLDQILDFASKDTGFAKHGPVKRQVVGREYVEAYYAWKFPKQAEEGLARSELVLKKIGLLAPDFDLKNYLVRATVPQLEGFYNFRDKTMYLLNWVPLERQGPIMAHELTHALQDQNYDLLRFMQSAPRAPAKAGNPGSMAVRGTDEEEEHSLASRALVEGQAMVVFLDYVLRPTGHTLAASPDALSLLSGALENYESTVALHDAPRVLRESATFPYREGLAFELELLRRGGRPMAFADAFARTPTNTYQILHPDAYLAKSATPSVSIPDIRPVLGDGFELFDSGTIGALDTRIMVREYGRENDRYTVAAQWYGGSYVAVKPTGVATQKLTPADISLFYVSRWKTAQAAERFAYLYKTALSKREPDAREQTVDNTRCVQTAPCGDPRWISRLVTKEGLAYLEVLPNNMTIVAQGFSDATVAQLRALVLSLELSHPGQNRARVGHLTSAPASRELGLSLYESPAFLAFQKSVLDSVLSSQFPVLSTEFSPHRSR